MNKITNFATICRIATSMATGIAVTTSAQTWINVNPAIVGVCGDIGVDASGNIYAAGRQIAPDGSSVAIVQWSANQGATWTTIDQFPQTGFSYAHDRAFAQNPVTGNLFAGGNLNNLLPDGTYQFDSLWFIREQNAGTGVWSTSDDYSKLASDVGQASCADIMVSPSGDVYATGGGQLGPGMGWITRKRPAGASIFSTVDADYSGQTSGTGWDLAFHSSYGVFAVGDANGIWTVRRSSTGNAGTWATVDSFYASRDWTGGSAKSILATPSKVHVVGSAYKYRNGTHWVVRSSSDGGLTWSISDDLAGSTVAEARGIAQDTTTGNLIVCGNVDNQWVVRKGVYSTKMVKQGKQTVPFETLTWTTIDTFQLAPGKSALPNGITIDHGNIFVAGSAQNANGSNQWLIRKLSPQ